MPLPIVIAAFPLLVYVVAALSIDRSSVTHPDDFFLAYRRAGATAFSSSSIAYAFQLSTIYPFLAWGAAGIFYAPLINAICWGLGIAIFGACSSRYQRFLGSDQTLHGFLGKQYGPTVRIVASYLSLIGLLGYMVAELYFGTKVLHSVAGTHAAFYIALFAIILLIYGYIAYGGQLSSMRTDQIQLAFSYIGIFGFFLYLLFVIGKSGQMLNGPLLFGFIVCIGYISAILIFRKFRYFVNIQLLKNGNGEPRSISTFLGIGIGTILTASLIGCGLLLLHNPVSARFPIAPALSGIGWAGIASLIILPLCWQFVDLTNWQRLLSIRSHTDSEGEYDLNAARKGLNIYALESPFTWILFLLFGTLIVSAFTSNSFSDILVDLPARLIHSSYVSERIFGYVFVTSILSIMFSTIDSFLVGTIFTFVYDTNPITRRLLDVSKSSGTNNLREILRTGRFFGLCVAIVSVFLLVFFDIQIKNGAFTFISVLFAFYSAQLSFFPLVFGILFLKKHPTAAWANASMILGAIPAIALGVYSVLGDGAYGWYPIVLCSVVSSSVYAMGYVVTNIEGPKRYWKRRENRLILAIFVSTIILGMFGSRIRPWESWEGSAIVFTLLYTVWIYVDGFFVHKHLGDLGVKKTGIAGLTIIGALLLGVVAWVFTKALFSDELHSSTNLNRPIIMFCLFSSSLAFCILDRIVATAGKEYSATYKRLFQYSDLPICVAFFILWLYSFKVKAMPSMDIFFAGAIAFQMMVSNVIWSVADDSL